MFLRQDRKVLTHVSHEIDFPLVLKRSFLFLLFIDSLTRSMAVEWGQYGIRSVGLAPGPIADTEGMRRLGKNLVSVSKC